MATSSTSTSALLSGAAKDDTVGLNSDYTFTVKELLANDPGGAAKYDLTKQFFFGDSGGTVNMTPEAQAAYMAAHNIVKINDLDGGTYQINAGADDFNYFVQIGNKGTWSEAHVDVTAPVPHLGPSLFSENFEGYQGDTIVNPSNGVTVASVVNMNGAQAAPPAPAAGDPIPVAATGGWSGAEHTELGTNGYGNIDTSGGHWLDTQNSPGRIDIFHTFTDSTPGVATPTTNLTTSVLSFDIGTQNVSFGGQTYATDPNASFEFRIDGQPIAHINAVDLATPNTMQHYDISIPSYIGGVGDQHTLELVDTSHIGSTPIQGYVGFAIDNVQIHDWIV